MSRPDNKFRDGYRFSRLQDQGFGGVLEFESVDPDGVLGTFARHADSILARFYAARGLMVVKGLQAIAGQPRALV
jgi:hypothetical protein